MTTMTTTNLENERAILDCHDEDGAPTSIEITITQDADGVYEVRAEEDGDLIDGESCMTLSEARTARDDMAKQIRQDDRTRERNRIKDQRRYARETILGASEELKGLDKDLVLLVARIVAGGRSAVALAALKSIAK